MIKISKGVVLLVVLENIADHSNKEENLTIYSSVDESFEDITKINFIQLFNYVLINVAKVLDIVLSNRKRLK